MQSDTTNQGWDNPNLGLEFCEAAKTASGVASSTLGSVIVFSHGVGSLVVASALGTNQCSFGSETRWYSAMAPFETALAADSAASLCNSYSAMSSVLDAFQVCYAKPSSGHGVEEGVTAQASTYTPTGGVTLQNARSMAETHLDGALCGHDPMGLYTGVGTGFLSIWSYVWFEFENDGWMDTDSCTEIKSAGSWQYLSDAVWSNLHINFADGTCRFGNALLDPWFDQSPCTWYKTMAQRA